MKPTDRFYRVQFADETALRIWTARVLGIAIAQEDEVANGIDPRPVIFEQYQGQRVVIEYAEPKGSRRPADAEAQCARVRLPERGRPQAGVRGGCCARDRRSVGLAERAARGADPPLRLRNRRRGVPKLTGTGPCRATGEL
jgi:hypothetical protein